MRSIQTVSKTSEKQSPIKVILIIQNDLEGVSFIKESIKNDTYSLINLSSGIEALEQVCNKQASAIDLVILDHLLPDMSGVEVLKKLKSQIPMIPVIYMSAYGNEDTVINAFRYGACDYLKKPFNMIDLIARIEFFTSQNITITNSKFIGSYHDSFLSDPYLLKASSSNYSYKIQKALSYINENYTVKLRLNDVARVACMSEYHFSRIFKRELSITYQDYVNKLRVDVAKNYLREKRGRVIDVALAVGYDDLSNFNYIFKKITGLTPTEFVKSLPSK